ncbi:MAG: hypothetical protein ACOC2W_00420 [bacterium]
MKSKKNKSKKLKWYDLFLKEAEKRNIDVLTPNQKKTSPEFTKK